MSTLSVPESAIEPTSKGAESATSRTSTSTSTLVSSIAFECTVLPPINSLSGALVPRIFQKGRHRRIVSVEVHRVDQHEAGLGRSKKALRAAAQELSSYEECVVRVLVPVSGEAKKQAKEQHRHRHGRGISGDGSASAGSTNGGDDDSTVGVSPEFMDAGAEFTIAGNDEGWKGKYRFPIKTISIKGTRRHSVIIEIDLGKKKDVREIIFDSIEESERFQTVLKREIAMDQERGNTKMKVAMGGETIRLDESLTFLVEIVSGWDLPIADFTSSDPFVKCILDGREIHRTAYISKTLDPVWTVSTGSLFLLTVDVKQLFRGEGLLCVVYDFDKLGKNDVLGAITVPPKTLYDAKGERMEFKLGPHPPGKMADVPGYLAVRVRRATDHDKQFMAKLNSTDSKLQLPGMEKKEPDENKFKGGSSNIKSLITRRSRIARSGENAGQREYKIRPGPDPKRVEETTWMTKAQLEAECEKESTHWVDAGSGRLGRLFVEILGCDDLPNLDTGGFAGNKTDAFVSLVYEDAVVQTDVVDDTLSPRWMPWTRRAFIFHMYHSSSQLFLGVFDYDEGITPTDDHDLVGRVSVDLSNLRKDTMYTLQYNIYTTARMSKRKRKGTITLRLRMEIEDERKLLLSAIEPPPNMYVNVKTRREFRVVRYTCTGKYNMEKYSMKVINSYIEELLALQNVVYYIQDGLKALLLWRGTLPIHVPVIDKSFIFPIHSLSAFLIAVLLVENPHMLPSLFFASIAWLMLAAQAYRRSLPDVWSRCKSFAEFVDALILGESRAPPDTIAVKENYDEAQAFLDRWQKRITDAEEAAAKAYEEEVRAQEEYEREMEEVGDTADTDIATQNGGGVSIDPFKGLLFPVQQNLALVCRYVRHIKYVISWQECYIAFWVTTGCLLLSFICFFVPWFFIIKWTTRLTMWSLFGPWMKLVDVYYVSKIKPLTEEELEQKRQRERDRRFLQTKTAVSEARKKREKQVKLKEMKRYLFGKYMTRVPVLKEDRYRDLPTPESHAEPYLPGKVPIAELAMQDAGYNKVRMPSQHLVGDMIPKVETLGFTEAPIGQPTAHMSMVDKNRPGGSMVPGTDSTAAAYMKLGSLVAAAAVLTWFGVPLLAAITERALSYAQ